MKTVYGFTHFKHPEISQSQPQHKANRYFEKTCLLVTLTAIVISTKEKSPDLYCCLKNMKTVYGFSHFKRPEISQSQPQHKANRYFEKTQLFG